MATVWRRRTGRPERRWTPERPGGRLTAVRDRLKGRAIAGIVLVSDGGDTSDAAEQAAPEGPPIFPVAVGSATAGRDREVLSVTRGGSSAGRSRVELAASAVGHGHGVAPIVMRLMETVVRSKCGRQRPPPKAFRYARRSASRRREVRRRFTPLRFRPRPVSWSRRTTREACSCSSVTQQPRFARRGRARFRAQLSQTGAGSRHRARD